LPTTPAYKVAFAVEEPILPSVNAIALLCWLIAGAVAFLPFAFDTSPWDAVRLRVPGNQGNWWHVLVGAPFFLAFPMIWLRLRTLVFRRPLSSGGRRLIWTAAGLSVCGTILVELPFVFHLAGTKGWPSLSILCAGLGIVVVSSALLFLFRDAISPTRSCIISINTAYLANAALCLVVYSVATGAIKSRIGYLITAVIVWPLALEIAWLFTHSFKMRTKPA
jgi:hypothetical protein